MSEKHGALLYQILLGIGIAVVFFSVGKFTPSFGRSTVSSPVVSSTTTESTYTGTSATSHSVTFTTAGTTASSATSTYAGATTTISHATSQLNLNTATKEELMTINGIGDVLAERIVAYREEHGGFKSVEELKNVKGIAEGRYAKFAPYLTLS